jgi:F-type H+-transporting ATPase subunit a
MNISLAAETIFHLFHLAIPNSVISGWLVSLFLICVALLVRQNLSTVPKRAQALFEIIYDYLLSTAESIIGRRDVAREVFPFIITAFLFILVSNWSGLLPGSGTIGFHAVHEGKNIIIPLLRAPTSDLNTTIALSAFAIGFIQYLGLKYAGPKAYIGKFLNFKSPIGFFIGFVELISEFARIISFSFRLFGNVFAGEVLITVIFYLTITLIPYLALLPLPFFMLELIVGMVQAFVFCFLTLVFISMAIVSHDGGGHSHGGEEVDPLSGHNPILHPVHNN